MDEPEPHIPDVIMCILQSQFKIKPPTVEMQFPLFPFHPSSFCPHTETFPVPPAVPAG